jgi:uracil-DNA glycosylase
MQSEQQKIGAIVSGYWDVLNLCEDYFKDGIKRKHEPLRFAAEKHDLQKPVLSTGDRPTRLKEIEQAVSSCENCDLCMRRGRTVPGEGVLDPLVMLIGEGPGAEEDRSGRPFVGRAGQYLDKWLESIDLGREKNVFITNIVKCRPPGNRDPLPEEKAQCVPFLQEQIEIIRPRSILALGRIAAQFLAGTTEGISRMRGNVYSYGSIPLVATYHPSAVLRNENLRRPVWEDLKLLRSVLDNE